MQVNAIVSLIKSNTLDEAQKLLTATEQLPHFKDDPEFAQMLRGIRVFLLSKDKKFAEALELMKRQESCNLHDAFIQAQLALSLKNHAECL